MRLVGRRARIVALALPVGVDPRVDIPGERQRSESTRLHGPSREVDPPALVLELVGFTDA